MDSRENLSDQVLDSMLSPSGGWAGDDRLRTAVLAQTTGVIRRRRRLKRLGLATALVGCYLAGVGTVSLWHSARDDRTNSAPAIAQDGDAEPTGGDADGNHRPIAPDQREQLAKLTPYDQWRRAGDRLLADGSDLAAAVRSYRRALKVASADQKQIEPARDSWLLAVLKNDQMNPYSTENSQ